MTPVKITVSALVNANAEKAWECYTMPGHIVQWNFADPSWHCPSAENDLRIGGKYSARMEAKDGSFGFDFETIYTDLKIGEMLAYEMADGRKATVFFNPAVGATEVVITFDAENENPVEMQRGGWQAILDNYKSYTESR